MYEKLVERAEAAITLGGKTGSRGKSPSNIYNVAADLLEALTLAQARIRELEEAIWLAHDQLNTYRSAAVEEVIDKLETYIPDLSGNEAPNV